MLSAHSNKTPSSPLLIKHCVNCQFSQATPIQSCTHTPHVASLPVPHPLNRSLWTSIHRTSHFLQINYNQYRKQQDQSHENGRGEPVTPAFYAVLVFAALNDYVLYGIRPATGSSLIISSAPLSVGEPQRCTVSQVRWPEADVSTRPLSGTNKRKDDWERLFLRNPPWGKFTARKFVPLKDVAIIADSSALALLRTDTTLLHDFPKMVIGNGIANIEKDGEKDHVLRIMLAIRADHTPIQD